MDDFATGTRIVSLDAVKMRLSYKDLLLLIGIIVAMIVAITTIGYRETAKLDKQSSSRPHSNSTASRSIISAVHYLLK